MIELTIWVLSAYAIFAFLIGVVIGIVGIGGVILIPFLVYIGGIDIHTVIPACMAGFAVSGLFAVYSYARQGSIRWDKAKYLIVGAAPGAYLGSITVWAVSSIVLEVVVAILVFVSGFNTVRKVPENVGDGINQVSGARLVVLGLLVGYGSSVSGTGGPLLLVPTLLLLNYPVLTTIGLSMAIQLPIAPFATLGHVLHGTIHWELAAPIAVGVSSGVLIGALIAHRVSSETLRKWAAVALIICGVFVTTQIFVD